MLSPPPGAALPSRPAHRRHTVFRVIVALMLREMSTRYGRNPGGYLWALLEPLGGIFILAFGFSMLVRNPPLGTSFILFYATGFLPFDLFQKVSQAISKSLRFSRPLLAYPTVSWIDLIIARFLLNTLTGLTTGYILITAILMMGDSHSVLEFWPILTAMGLAALLGLAVGCLNAVISGFYPIWDSVWSIVTRPLFLISGTLILFESLPKNIGALLWYNPLIHITGEMRRGFYPMYDAGYVNLTYTLMLSLGILAFSLMLLHRFHREILDT